ncbi:MAG TPA: metallophosphoesterase, partial [Gemmatimonadales bacterium]|nr:metallophosphoesterase [Gemmatimonadales bacterium]
MLALLFAASFAVAQVPDSAHVVLVATTDVHGRATGWDYVARRAGAGGLARVAPIVDSLRRRYPGQVIVLDAGDVLQGDPFATYHARVAPATPHPVVEAMNLVGYDAATPGNHDLDFGVPLFEKAVGDAAFPFVSGNLYAVPGDTLVFPAFRVLQRQGVRVAVAGFTTPGTMVWNRDRLRGKLRVGPIAASVEPALASMRRLSDLTVVLMHSGLGGPASYDTAGVGDEDVGASLATLPFRPDVVVVGHSHREIADSVINGVHFVQPRRYAESVSVVHVDLRRVGGRWGVSRVRGELVRTGGRAPSPLLAQRLAGAHAAVQGWVDEPLA